MANSFEDRVKGAVANLARNVNSSLLRATSPANDSSARSDTTPSDSSFFRFGSDEGLDGGVLDASNSDLSAFNSSLTDNTRAGSMVFAIGTIGIDYPTVAIRDRLKAKIAESEKFNVKRLSYLAGKLEQDAANVRSSEKAFATAARAASNRTSPRDTANILETRENNLYTAGTNLDKDRAAQRETKRQLQEAFKTKELLSSDDDGRLIAYLRGHVNEAPLLNWVFKVDGVESFIVRPNGAFAEQYFYDVLVNSFRSFDLNDDGTVVLKDISTRSLAGRVVGGGRLGSGAVLPVVVPEPALGPNNIYKRSHSGGVEISDDELKEFKALIKRFRKLGTSSEDRAVNYVLAIKLDDLVSTARKAMASAINVPAGLNAPPALNAPAQNPILPHPQILDMVASAADISRPGSTSMFVHCRFFDSSDAFKNIIVVRYTLDVSLPEPNVFDDDTHHWIERADRL